MRSAKVESKSVKRCFQTFFTVLVPYPGIQVVRSYVIKKLVRVSTEIKKKTIVDIKGLFTKKTKFHIRFLCVWGNLIFVLFKMAPVLGFTTSIFSLQKA